MRWQLHLISLLLSVSIIAAGVKYPKGQKSGDKGYWEDISTELMWARQDNGREVKWYKAKRYCRNLRLGGFDDWRLPTIDELESIHAPFWESPGRGGGKDHKEAVDWHVKGNLVLTGREWSSTKTLDHFTGGPSSFVWCFGFSKRKDKIEDDASFLGSFHYALCVRNSSAPDRPVIERRKDPPVTWIDSASGLMWSGQDNGRDISWSKAVKYCAASALDGYTDWRLATRDELEGIYDDEASVTGLGSGKDGRGPSTFHVKGNLLLTGRQWSDTGTGQKILEDKEIWFVDFSDEHRRTNDSPWLYSSASQRMRVLCVRNAGK